MLGAPGRFILLQNDRLAAKLTVIQKIALTAMADQLLHADAPPQATQKGGDDRVSGSDADRHDDISRTMAVPGFAAMLIVLRRLTSTTLADF